jgi:hypothetical protein
MANRRPRNGSQKAGKANIKGNPRRSQRKNVRGLQACRNDEPRGRLLWPALKSDDRKRYRDPSSRSSSLSAMAKAKEIKRRGDWIQTRSGLSFFPLDPRAEDINIFDIASALSKQCRFTGHSNCFYSVGQHSVHVSELVPPELALAGLLHDASEAYLSDLPSPLKRLPEFAFYRKAEDFLQRLIYRRFGVTVSVEHDAIKEADIKMLVTEARDIMSSPELAWVSRKVKPRKKPITPWEPKKAFTEFMLRFDALALTGGKWS